MGHHPLLAFLDRPEIGRRQHWPGCCHRARGSNTAVDCMTVHHQALACLQLWRPDPHDPAARTALVRCEAAGFTDDFVDACRDGELGFSFGFPVDARMQDAVDTLILGDARHPAIDIEGGLRDGAQLRFSEADRLLVTALGTAPTP